jgi:Xaa-Pro aminopeptidase
MDTRTSPARARIARLREVMHSRGIDAVLVPSSDPHLSEYLPGRWQGRQHFSGFTGSMATLVVTTDKAALFADSRYWTQAESELQGSGIALVKIPTGAAVHHLDWLATEVRRGGVVAVDGDVLGLAASQALRSKLAAAGVALKTDTDILADAWDERAALPQARV